MNSCKINDINMFPSDLEFSVFTAEEIKRISAVQVITGLTFDPFGHPLPGGLYDLLMGNYDRNLEPCGTCFSVKTCPGHIGHIQLNVLVYNPFFVKLLQRLCNVFCIHCHKYQAVDYIKRLITLQLRLIDAGYIVEAQELETYKSAKTLEIFSAPIKSNQLDDGTGGVKQERDDSEPIDEANADDDHHGFMIQQRMVELYALLDNHRHRQQQQQQQQQHNYGSSSSNDERVEATKTSCALRTAIIHSALQRSTTKKCIHCRGNLRYVKFMHQKLVYYMTLADIKEKNPDVSETSGQYKVILASEMQKYVRSVYRNNPMLLELLFPVLKQLSNKSSMNSLNEEGEGEEREEEHVGDDNQTSPVDIFFIEVLPVTPPNARPPNKLPKMIVEHPQTAVYRSIIQNNFVVKAIMMYMKKQQDHSNESISEAYADIVQSTRGQTNYEKLYNAWQDLQTSVDVLLDVRMSRDAPTSTGLKQILEKKEGLIRKHMMGKRVNYAARTVITPDPNISVEEVGIPDVFAKRLSYPVPVTSWNVAELRKMVINGPNIHPGANYIKDNKGITTFIPADNIAKRESLAKTLFNYPEKGLTVVHRHVVNGDILLLNRQPSLHRPSMMAHKVRILKGEKTIRLHYSNCKAYNADFDGDEMNAHLPQNEVARSEAYHIANVANNYLVPKDGTPLGGLIQDHIISGVKLSMRGRFFNREDYHNLVFQGLSHMRGDIELLPPTIIKPARLWSGKQIISTIIINLIPKGLQKINLTSEAKIRSKHWAKDAGIWSPFNEKMCESQVIIRNGELLSGVLDKAQYGATTFGLVHCMYELYGSNAAASLLTAFTKLFTHFLQREGFTLGVRDILVTKEADKARRQIIRECRDIGHKTVAMALNLEKDEELSLPDLADKMEEAYIKDPHFRILLDRKYKSVLDKYTNDINSACLPQGLITQFPENNLQLMVLSGAKGSMVNTMQISCLLGQIELEGKRPPLMISGKSLPSFTSFETSPKSGGYVDGRFMTGIQPQEFFFHCMAGREGLIDTAVKTSRSGYLQRCLIKHLEGLTVNYDLTVRDSDNTVVQYLYGEDGIDVMKAKFFANENGWKVLAENEDVILQPDELNNFKDLEMFHRISKHKKSLRHWLKKMMMHRKRTNVERMKSLQSPFTHFSAQLRNEIDVHKPKKLNSKTGRRRLDEKIIKLWNMADYEKRSIYIEAHSHCPDPATSLYRQDICYGSVSERLEQIVANCIHRRPDKKKSLLDIMCLKNMKALAQPGEPVGLLAAQSIGEPSTQMTLNTFHFAGRGEMNVTLGIPRLREILMLASSNIKTPSMDIPIRSDQLKAAEKLRISLNRVTLADVLQFIKVRTFLVFSPTRTQRYVLTFQLLPRDVYRKHYGVRPKEILEFIKTKFFHFLMRSIIKSRTTKAAVVEISDENQTNSMNAEGDDESGEGEGEDGDVGGSKSKSNSGNKKSNRKGSSDHQRGGKDSADANGNDEDEDQIGDDDDEDDDDDATGIKLKSRRTDEKDYDDPDDMEEIADADDDGVEDLDEENPQNELRSNEFDLEEEEEEEEDDEHIKDLAEQEERAKEKSNINKMLQDYIYDEEHHLWCQLTFNLNLANRQPILSSILKELAQKAVIHEVNHIKRAIIYKNNENLAILKTDGINMKEMCKYNDILEVNRLYSNDIHAIAQTYGIEAANRVIVREVTNVFNVYGITVDYRHLSLIADYMTFDGTFKPLSRKGMESSSSPLQQMSFESSLQFLRNATGFGNTDRLNSPSSRLMVGLPVRNGTGSFDLLTKLD